MKATAGEQKIKIPSHMFQKCLPKHFLKFIHQALLITLSAKYLTMFSLWFWKIFSNQNSCPCILFWNLRMWLDSIFWELSKRNSMDFRMLSSLLELPSPWNRNACTFQDAFRELAVSGNVTKFLEALNGNLYIWSVLVGASCCRSVPKIYTSQSTTNSDTLIVVYDYFPYVNI